eukprot:SAG31_NODE_11572_length_1016_cov_4.076336_1_plen_207_part_01
MGHNGSVNSVAFDPSGGTLASGSADHTVKLWDVASGECLRTLEGHSNDVKSVAFDASGGTLASGSADATVKLWDVASGECLRTLRPSCERALLQNLGGRGCTALATCRLCQGDCDSDGDCDHGLACFQRDGNTPVPGCSEGGAGNGSTPPTHDFCYDPSCSGSGVGSVAFDPSGGTLASGSNSPDHTVKLWDVASGECLRTLQGHSG